ncbi:hypothetical protein WJ968_15025 [Achromobacter xylosoxidans]
MRVVAAIAGLRGLGGVNVLASLDSARVIGGPQVPGQHLLRGAAGRSFAGAGGAGAAGAKRRQLRSAAGLDGPGIRAALTAVLAAGYRRGHGRAVHGPDRLRWSAR